MNNIDLKTGVLSLEITDDLRQLIGFASRENKKRGFLFVSKVLGKHIPNKPSEIDKVHRLLAEKIKNKIADEPTVFIGFAETATGLGNGVYQYAKNENSFYIHTTRYNLSFDRLVEFNEEHSHAVSHVLYKVRDADLENILLKAKNIVLIDDEISTGKTLLNIISQLKKSFPYVENYYCVSILNWMRECTDNIDFISLHKGTFSFSEKDFEINNPAKSVTENNEYLDNNLPGNFGRFGLKEANMDYAKFVDITKLKDKRILVLGTGEFMYQPYLFAKYLEDNGIEAFVQSTTRSPVNEEYDIKSKIAFKDNYGEYIDNFLYNVIDKTYDYIFICYETIPEVNDGSLKLSLQKYFDNVEEIYF